MSAQGRWFTIYLAIFITGFTISIGIFVGQPELDYDAFSRVMLVTATLPSVIGLAIGIRARLFERSFRFATLASVVGGIFALWFVSGALAMLGWIMTGSTGLDM